MGQRGAQRAGSTRDHRLVTLRAQKLNGTAEEALGEHEGSQTGNFEGDTAQWDSGEHRGRGAQRGESQTGNSEGGKAKRNSFILKYMS